MVILTTLSDGIMTNPAFVDMNDFNPYWPMPIGRSPSFTIVGTTMPNMTMCSSDKYWWGGKIEAVMPIPTVGHQRDLGNSLLQSTITCARALSGRSRPQCGHEPQKPCGNRRYRAAVHYKDEVSREFY